MTSILLSKYRYPSILIVMFFGSLGFLSSQDFNYHVEPAPEWTNLFYRTSGWFGGDGVFSIGLDGNDENDGSERTLVIFGDTFIGEVENGAPKPDYKMVHNTVAYVSGVIAEPENIEFHYKQDLAGKPVSFFDLENPNEQLGQFHWLGDGFVNVDMDSTLYLFAYHIEWTGDNVFDFIEPDVSLIAIPSGSEPPFTEQRHINVPLHVMTENYGEGNFGSGIFANTSWASAKNPDGYIYVYGCIGSDKNLIAARIKSSQFENIKKWRFWDGKDWVKEIENVVPITNAVSNELSVTQLDDDRYLLVFQVLGISDKVGVRVGKSPIGPFGDIIEIYRTPEFDEGLWPYNAKAHPALSKEGELLISYNTITPDFWNDIEKDAHIYRPRFIRLILD